MNTQSIHTRSVKTASMGWSGSPPTIASGLLAQARGLEIVAMLATRLAVVLLPALAIVMASTLAVSTPGTAVYLQAALWAGGFLFYALATESDRPGVAALLVGTGAAIQALAWLSGRVSPELGIAAAALVAAWLTIVIARFVLRQM
jgi:hypothetical protein